MKRLVDIRKYQTGLNEVSITIGTMRRLCPLYKVDAELWVVGNEHLSFGTDVEFTQNIGANLAEKLMNFKADCILTAESKSLGIAYEIARKLEHGHFAVARKSIKPYDTDYLSTEIHSITSSKNEFLYLDQINMRRIEGKKIILFDDVISTGSTMNGLLELTKKSGAEAYVLAAVWLEGPWPFEQFTGEFKMGRLKYLDILPIYAAGKTYDELIVKQVTIENDCLPACETERKISWRM